MSIAGEVIRAGWAVGRSVAFSIACIVTLSGPVVGLTQLGRRLGFSDGQLDLLGVTGLGIGVVVAYALLQILWPPDPTQPGTAFAWSEIGEAVAGAVIVTFIAALLGMIAEGFGANTSLHSLLDLHPALENLLFIGLFLAAAGAAVVRVRFALPFRLENDELDLEWRKLHAWILASDSKTWLFAQFLRGARYFAILFTILAPIAVADYLSFVAQMPSAVELALIALASVTTVAVFLALTWTIFRTQTEYAALRYSDDREARRRYLAGVKR